MSRREILKLALMGALSFAALSTKAEAIIAKRLTHARKFCTGNLFFHSVHTGESIRVQYMGQNGRFNPFACKRLNHFFRCPHTGQVIDIPPSLFVLLDAVHARLGKGGRPYILYSGYRSPAYNRLLARRGPHVARNSYHLRGMAADVALEGIPASTVANVAQDLGIGGVGSYDDFTHLDLGPVRQWQL